MSLRNTTALVTGASSGIGRATAIALAKEGASVGIAARRVEHLREVADDIEAEGADALVLPTDVTDEAQVRDMVQSAIDRFEGLDAVIANAGVGRQSAIEEMSTEDYRTVMGVNVDGAFFTTREAIPALRKSGGHLVFIGSIGGKRPYQKDPVYGASKWWLRGFAMNVAGQLGDDDVGVSVLNPTGVRTPFDAKYREPNTERFAPGSRPEPEDIADVIVFAVRQDPPNVIFELDYYTRDEFVP